MIEFGIGSSKTSSPFVFRIVPTSPKTKVKQPMTRGNQRDLAREKGLKKAAEEGKGQRKDGQSYAKAKESDAEIMRKKQEAAAAKKAEKGS